MNEFTKKFSELGQMRKEGGVSNSHGIVRILEMAGTYNGNRYLNIESNASRCLYSAFLNEGNEYEKIKGGIITFPNDVNDNDPSDCKWVNNIKQFMLSSRISSEQKLNGWTIGHYFSGRYKDGNNGQQFNEDSLSLEIIGADTDTLIKIAEELCVAFKQQHLLVKDYNSLRVMFIEPSCKTIKDKA